MSVVVILAILWWAICGVICVAAGIWGLFSVLGPTSRIVIMLIVGTVGSHLLERYFCAEEECAKAFLKSWKADSDDYPLGIMYSDSPGKFIDYDKFGSLNPYLAKHLRLRYYSTVKAVGEEEISPKGDPTPVRAEIFLSDVRVHSSEQDLDFNAKLRIWICKDSDKVVQFQFEDIEFR